ncbi:MAG: sporulation protein YunB [Oscillospiraceae bacterium]|nr:sporulation protein YunB [Oscillospiraceae bacterium]
MKRYIAKNRRSRKFFAYVLLITTAASILFIYTELRLRPVASELALARARSVAITVMGESVYEVIDADGITYDDIIHFEKDNNGRISALTTNIVKLNILKSKISLEIQKRLNNIQSPELVIPLGSILNGEFFSGKGPGIRIKLLPAGSAAAEITNVFTEAGINQTRHQIMLRVSLSVSVILPTSTVSTDVVSSVCIAETVIVGEVPESFTQVITSDSTIPGLINDYNAEDKLNK